MVAEYDTPSGGAPFRLPRQKATASAPKGAPNGADVPSTGRPTAPTATKPALKAPDKSARDRTPTAVSTERQCEALAETVMSSILDRLTAEAERKGGMLSIDDIAALDQEFKKKTQALQMVFQASFEEYVRAREQSVWDKAREYPFGRLLVNQFVACFADKEGHRLKDGAVSRRIIPGFFIAINMMLGPEFVESAQQLCRGVIDRLKARRGASFDWMDFYADPDTKEILSDALMAMAPFFAHAERRMAWMLDIINSHLEPAEPESMEGEDAAHWILDEHGMRDVLAHLFQSLRDSLANPGTRSALAQRHGDEALDDVNTVMTRLFGL